MEDRELHCGSCTAVEHVVKKKVWFEYLIFALGKPQKCSQCWFEVIFLLISTSYYLLAPWSLVFINNIIKHVIYSCI